MDRSEQQLCGASGVEALIESLATELSESLDPRKQMGFIGVHRRGVPLARRLSAGVQRIWDVCNGISVGALDITLYRDDLDKSPHRPVLSSTSIPYSVDGRTIILVDDVLFTGRTIRAALNAICDLGRPSQILLAVAVDRGHRELPIAADFVGMTIKLAPEQRVLLRLTPMDPVDELVQVCTNVERGSNLR